MNGIRPTLERGPMGGIERTSLIPLLRFLISEADLEDDNDRVVRYTQQLGLVLDHPRYAESSDTLLEQEIIKYGIETTSYPPSQP